MYSSDRNSGATPIRNPSTANLAIDSYDRSEGRFASDFVISKSMNIMSGFFTRFAVNEIVLDWALPNISATHGNNLFSVIVGSTPYTVSLPEGNYTIARVMNSIVTLLNGAGTGLTWSIVGDLGASSLHATGAYTAVYTVLSGQLSMTRIPNTNTPSDANNNIPFPYPSILPVTYLDFTSTSLTYQQGLKDSDTTKKSKDVLYRWVFSWDDYNPLDTLGYPIYQGYMPFKSRRSIAFPKQIKWDGQQPLGQLIFQVYGSDGEYAQTTQVVGGFEWNMNILVSEQ